MLPPRDILIRTVLPSLALVLFLSVVLRMQIWGLLDFKMVISNDLVTLSKLKNFLFNVTQKMMFSKIFHESVNKKFEFGVQFSVI